MPRPKQPLSPWGIAAFILLGLTISLWIWTGEWKWALTGLIAIIVCAVCDAGSK